MKILKETRKKFWWKVIKDNKRNEGYKGMKGIKIVKDINV